MSRVPDANFLQEMDRSHIGKIATISKDAWPHVVPVCFACDAEHIYVDTSPASKKAANLRSHDRVCFMVEEHKDDWSLLVGRYVLGTAKLISQGLVFARGRSLIYRKYPLYEKYLPIREGQSAIVQVTPTSGATWDDSIKPGTKAPLR